MKDKIEFLFTVTLYFFELIIRNKKMSTTDIATTNNVATINKTCRFHDKMTDEKCSESTEKKFCPVHKKVISDKKKATQKRWDEKKAAKKAAKKTPRELSNVRASKALKTLKEISKYKNSDDELAKTLKSLNPVMKQLTNSPECEFVLGSKLTTTLLSIIELLMKVCDENCNSQTLSDIDIGNWDENIQE